MAMDLVLRSIGFMFVGCRAGNDRGCALCTATTDPGGLKADFFQNLPLLLLADFVLDGIEVEEVEEEDIASKIKKSIGYFMC